jgi:adenylosuccinate lyase
VPALFTEAARLQSWLDVAAGPGRAEAELRIIPEAAGHKIVRKATSGRSSQPQPMRNARPITCMPCESWPSEG